MNTTLLHMPDKVERDESVQSSTFGRFILQPLEKGFGVTLGNSFRRVLLSSIPGSAITAVRIDGIPHEFSTIKGVTEDVVEMVLNLKQVRIKPISKKVTKVNMKIKGPGKFTAKDIESASGELEVMNPSLHIATLGKDANFEMELRIGRGKGYVVAEENKSADFAIGTIAVDSIFTPIKNVHYTVEPTRVGGQTDFEKLILEIETDGTIAPQEAISIAGKILRDHVGLFITSERPSEGEKGRGEEDAEFVRVRKMLLTSVDDMELSVRSHNCLRSADIKTIGELVRRTESELLKFRNFGRKSLAELASIVEEKGLHFGMDVDKYVKDGEEA